MSGLFNKRYSIIQKYMELRLSQAEPTGTVLMFHDIYATRSTPPEPGIALSASNFEQLLDQIEKTRRVATIHHFSDVERLTAGDVVLTFDDMFDSAYENAVPLLRERKIPYVAFVATGLVGEPGYLTREALADLQKDPLCTVGAHSVHHQLFRFQPETVIKEVQESVQALGADLFAFPYGSIYACSSKNQLEVSRSGCVSCAFSTLDAPLSKRALQNRFFLPRRNMNDTRFEAGSLI
ncbi:polysaccharide deacetylase family protein [Lawsonibacter sp. LCP25S3_G6]|uniref:polysaccharide deacetylase family protein n=1 Tax=unclassified Lawsonibacter TaxID=2617946 RepID=UPI003F951A59